MPKNSTKLTWEARHVSLSVSICRNFPGYTLLKCFITAGDSWGYLNAIAAEAHRILLERYVDVMSSSQASVDAATAVDPPKSGKHLMEKLLETFDEYLEVLPVLGFNSGKYDNNAVKVPLLKFIMDKDNPKNVIKM